MDTIKYIEMLSKTADHQEIENLLKGYDMKVFLPSQYEGGHPIDTGMVLSKVIYPSYKFNPHVKGEVEEVLYEMLFKTDYDVYIVVLYVMSELFKEKHNIAPFKMNLEKIFYQMSKELSRRKISIQDGIRYPNGCIKTSAWDEFVRFKNVCEQEYARKLF